MNEYQITFPEVFITGKIPEGMNDKRLLCAAALEGWGCCYLAMRPENFGIGMAAIGTRLGITPTPENLMEYAKKFH